NWLTLPQAEQLLGLPDLSTIRGKRDRALLSLLLGAGLRRAEVTALTFEHIQQREGRWVIVDLVGNTNASAACLFRPGAKWRSIPGPRRHRSKQVACCGR